MSVIEVLQVAACRPDADLLRGWNIEVPVSGTACEVHALDIQGWVLGLKSPAATLEVLLEGDVVQRAPIDLRRLDIAQACADVRGADTCGFRTSVNLAALSGELELLVRAILA